MKNLTYKIIISSITILLAFTVASAQKGYPVFTTDTACFGGITEFQNLSHTNDWTDAVYEWYEGEKIGTTGKIEVFRWHYMTNKVIPQIVETVNGKDVVHVGYKLNKNYVTKNGGYGVVQLKMFEKEGSELNDSLIQKVQFFKLPNVSVTMYTPGGTKLESPYVCSEDKALLKAAVTVDGIKIEGNNLNSMQYPYIVWTDLNNDGDSLARVPTRIVDQGSYDVWVFQQGYWIGNYFKKEQICANKATVQVLKFTKPNLNVKIVDGTSTVPLGKSVDVEVEGDVVEYRWLPASESIQDIYNPTITPKQTMTYSVIGTDINGCLDTAYLELNVGFPVDEIADANTILTPERAFNNVWMADKSGAGLFANTDFYVYNSFGQLIYSQGKGEKKTWNGVTDDNKDAPEGTYYYLIKGDSEGKEKIFRGFITVLR